MGQDLPLKRIAYLTDGHLDEEYLASIGVDAWSNWQLLLNDVASRNIEDVFFGGDIGSSSSHERFFESLSEIRLKLCLGNHDDFVELRPRIANLLPAGHSELFYSFEDEYFKHIVLDSSSGRISPLQFEWLGTALKTNKKILLFVHHPVLEIDTAADAEFPLRGRAEIRNELANAGNQVFIFCGHYHMEDERTKDNITQFITPASSYCIEKSFLDSIEVKPNSFGYRIIELANESVSTELIEFNSEESSTLLGDPDRNFEFDQLVVTRG